MLTWHYVTQNNYNNMSDELKLPNKLFFIKDTNKIFCGTDIFKDHIIIYNTSIPTTNLLEKLYINANTLEGKIFDGNSWIDIINPVTNFTINKYIRNTEISYVEYDDVSNNILVVFTDDTTDIVVMDDLVLDLVYNKFTGGFIINHIIAKLLNHNEMINLDAFIEDITYNNENAISIKFKDKSVLNITIGSLIENSNNDIINLSITSNEFIAECVLASDEYNSIIESGSLFVVCKNNCINISNNSSYNITNNVITQIINILQSVYYKYDSKIN